MASTQCEVQDTDLICPVCDYNLTGLTEHRCPECGEPFDPATLRRLAGDEAAPAVPWDTVGGVSGFVRTWAMALITPHRLADTFPGRHDALRAIGYSWCCYGLAVIIYVTIALLATASQQNAQPRYVLWALYVALGTAVATVLGWWLCENAVAGMLKVCVEPKHTRRHLRFRFWRGLAHYTSGFSLLTAGWGSLIWLAVSHELLDAGFPVVMCAAGLGILGWWVGAWWAMIARRARPGIGRIVSCVLVPAVGAGAIFLGYCGCFLVLAAAGAFAY